MRDLTAFFSPKSVCIIGASASADKLGSIVERNIITSGYKGQLYLVNPKYQTIGDHQCYPDVKSLPEVPDLAVVATPGPVVLQLLPEIGEKGIKNVVVFAAGFKETGPEGAKMEEALVEISQKYSLNILGPNCFGFVNNLCPINITFGPPLTNLGNLRFVSQSGAIASSAFDWCRSTNLGFAEFVTLGNKADLNENDILEYFKSHPIALPAEEQAGLSSVSPIGLYLESIVDGKGFLEISSNITKKDPVFIIKPGKTSAAAKAMQSHTGAIAGEDNILEAALNQAGVIRAKTLEDFFDYSKTFSWENAPTGPRVAIVSNAGGPAVISADAVVENGLKLAEMDEATKKQLSDFLPRSASLLNPVDVLGDALADQYCKATEVILQNDGVHAVIAILTPQIMTQIDKTAEKLGALSGKYQKPILCSFIGGTQIFAGEQILHHFKIPTFRYPEQAIAALGTMWRFKKAQEVAADVVSTLPVSIDLEKIHPILALAQQNNQKTLDNFQANEILMAAGINTPPTQKTADLTEAEDFSRKNGWPVVLKISSPGLLHKKEVGGVITSIENEEQLKVSWEKLQQKITQLDPEAKASATVQIQKEILNGVETIVGIKHDPTFGEVLLFGAGGSLAELIADRNLYLLPIDRKQAYKLVEGSKVYSLLKGYGTEPTYAIDKLADQIVRLGNLAQSLPEVSDIEINPVVVTLSDAWAVDGKVILSAGKRQPVSAPKFASATTLTQQILAGNFYYLEFEADAPFVSQPGQYISVKVAADRVNCYSLVGHVGNKFSLLVDTTPGGPGSKFFANLKPGDKIAFLGPFGTFTLKTVDGAQQLLFLGTGCGFAPLRAQIEAALSQSDLPMTLYISFRSSKEVIWQDYLDQLAKIHPNFHYQITVDQAGDGWQGEVGYLTDLIKKDIPDAKNFAVYLCGSHAMVENATALLETLGLPKEKIYTEKL